MDAEHLPLFLSDRDIADFVGERATWMTSLRARGEGPPFMRLGYRTIRYKREDFLSWLAARTFVPEHPESRRSAPPTVAVLG